MGPRTTRIDHFVDQFVDFSISKRQKLIKAKTWQKRQQAKEEYSAKKMKQRQGIAAALMLCGISCLALSALRADNLAPQTALVQAMGGARDGEKVKYLSRSVCGGAERWRALARGCHVPSRKGLLICESNFFEVY